MFVKRLGRCSSATDTARLPHPFSLNLTRVSILKVIWMCFIRIFNTKNACQSSSQRLTSFFLGCVPFSGRKQVSLCAATLRTAGPRDKTVLCASRLIITSGLNFFRLEMDVSKNSGKTPKMDGEHKGKPY